ncbi:MAG: hypothetical protein HY297_00905 [Thaumarchaeota archaeon]|nr:hypothetical protein [Nitrososphaerota archaeon]
MEEISGRRHAVARMMWAVVAVVIVIAGAGVYVYYNGYTTGNNNTTNTTYRTGTTVPTNIILSGTTSAGFYKGQIVSFLYSRDYQCLPALSNYVTNQTEANSAVAHTMCEVAGGDKDALPNAAPVFILVPAYAGLSIFGVPALGATTQGYPVFNNNVVFTQCGAGIATSACSDHPPLIYSPYFSLVEQHLGIHQGLPAAFGGPLPEGVLPTPAHSHVVNYVGGPSIPWYVVTVLVFDPNVMPDGQTGQCHKWVNSNLTNPTGNCLNSFTAIQSALTTKTTATANANQTQDDPIYDTLGGVATQVAIPGVTLVSDTSATNTNLFLWFAANTNNPFSG